MHIETATRHAYELFDTAYSFTRLRCRVRAESMGDGKRSLNIKHVAQSRNLIMNLRVN